MANKPLPDQLYLREALDYDPATGILTWRERPAHHFSSSERAAANNTMFADRTVALNAGKRYPAICIHYKKYSAHRIIWKWMTGEDPPHEIDHIDGDGANLRWSNLRTATRKQNTKNIRMRKDNRQGFKGVHADRNGRRFWAMIQVDRKQHYLGSFGTAEEAHAAYCEAAKRLHGEFFNPG